MFDVSPVCVLSTRQEYYIDKRCTHHALAVGLREARFTKLLQLIISPWQRDHHVIVIIIIIIIFAVVVIITRYMPRMRSDRFNIFFIDLFLRFDVIQKSLII